LFVTIDLYTQATNYVSLVLASKMDMSELLISTPDIEQQPIKEEEQTQKQPEQEEEAKPQTTEEEERGKRSACECIFLTVIA
jgi:hypothetical protein